MHYQTLLVSLFATTALAKSPWVSSFYNADCTGKGHGSISVLSDNCSGFQPTYDVVAVNFGTNWGQITSLSVYSDANCEIPTTWNINSTMADGTPQQGISMAKIGARWGSVRKTLP